MDLKTLAANESTLYLWLTCTVLSRSCFSSKSGWLVMIRPMQSFTPASNCMLPANTACLGVVELQRIKVGDLCLITTTLWCTLLSLGWACVRIYASGTALRMCVYACLLGQNRSLYIRYSISKQKYFTELRLQILWEPYSWLLIIIMRARPGECLCSKLLLTMTSSLFIKILKGC